MNNRQSIGATILILSLAILWATSGKAQLSLQAGAGYKNSFAGHLAIAYEYKQIETSTVMLSLPFRKATFFSQTIGKIFISEDWQIKPYGGIALKYVGNKSTTDRYIKDGVTQVLERNREVNQWYGSFGLLAVKDVWFADFNYTNRFSVSIGMRYTFNKNSHD